MALNRQLHTCLYKSNC